MTADQQEGGGTMMTPVNILDTGKLLFLGILAARLQIILNPPYGIPGKVLNYNCEKQEISRNQETDTMDRFLSSASRILKGRGRIAICYPAAQMLFLMDQLKSYRLEPKRFQLVYPFEDRAPKLVLIEAVKDARPMLHPLPPLVIYQKNGDLTNRLKSIYHLL